MQGYSLPFPQGEGVEIQRKQHGPGFRLKEVLRSSPEAHVGGLNQGHPPKGLAAAGG